MIQMVALPMRGLAQRGMISKNQAESQTAILMMEPGAAYGVLNRKSRENEDDQ
jgi:hypothetical protein